MLFRTCRASADVSAKDVRCSNITCLDGEAVLQSSANNAWKEEGTDVLICNSAKSFVRGSMNERTDSNGEHGEKLAAYLETTFGEPYVENNIHSLFRSTDHASNKHKHIHFTSMLRKLRKLAPYVFAGAKYGGGAGLLIGVPMIGYKSAQTEKLARKDSPLAFASFVFSIPTVIGTLTSPLIGGAVGLAYGLGRETRTLEVIRPMMKRHGKWLLLLGGVSAAYHVAYKQGSK